MVSAHFKATEAIRARVGCTTVGSGAGIDMSTQWISPSSLCPDRWWAPVITLGFCSVIVACGLPDMVSDLVSDDNSPEPTVLEAEVTAAEPSPDAGSATPAAMPVVNGEPTVPTPPAKGTPVAMPELALNATTGLMAPAGWTMKTETNGGLNFVRFDETAGDDKSPTLAMVSAPVAAGVDGKTMLDGLLGELTDVEFIEQRDLTPTSRFVLVSGKAEGTPARFAGLYARDKAQHYVAFFVAPAESFEGLGGKALLMRFAGVDNPDAAATANNNATPQASASAMAAAKKAGLPKLTAADGIAGPFDADDGMVYYVDKDGRISVFDPTGMVGYFGTLKPQAWQYSMNPQGYYEVRAGKAKKLRGAPDALATYPLAVAMAHSIIAQFDAHKRAGTLPKQYRSGSGSGGGRSRGGTNAATLRMMSDMSRMSHETSMTIINNMGGGGCTNHYSGTDFVGCW